MKGQTTIFHRFLQRLSSPNNDRRFWGVFLLLLPAIIFTQGCGGGSGDGGGVTSGSLVTVLIPIKISTEGSSDQDGLFASIKGSGANGGWIEDTKATRIPNSDLLLDSVANNYQVVLKGYPGTFLEIQLRLHEQQVGRYGQVRDSAYFW